MNSLHLPHYRQRPIRLHDEASFAEVKAPPPEFAHERPHAFCAQLVGRHCAGIRGRPGGREVLDYLRGVAGGGRVMEWTVRSLLNGCSGGDASRLVALCQVPVDQLARRARDLDVTNFGLIRYLNQFATVPEE